MQFSSFFSTPHCKYFLLFNDPLLEEMIVCTTKNSLDDKRSRNNNLKTGCNNQIQYDFLFLITVTTRRS